MLKVPKYIRKKMRSVAAHACIAEREMRDVENWLTKHGFDPETLRDGGGCSLEELEYGNDITGELCERIELLKGGEG